jgi:hypothetical protein
LRQQENPLVIDLGYGATPTTTVELHDRISFVSKEIRVLGLEIDAERVARGLAVANPPHLDFAKGGFEFTGRTPHVVRAFNVLRQYSEETAEQAWRTMCALLAPQGLLIEGTCDEIGRKCTWVTLGKEGPRTLTLACAPQHLQRPSDLAPRLPKSLIHHNVPGEKIHALLTELDNCWDQLASQAPFGNHARWAETIRLATQRGLPVQDSWRRWRLGEVTVPWSVVAP